MTKDQVFLITLSEQAQHVFCQHMVLPAADLDSALQPLRCPIVAGTLATLLLIADEDISEFDEVNQIYRGFDMVVQALMKETGFDRLGLKAELQRTLGVMESKWPDECHTVRDAIPDVDAAIMALIPFNAIYNGRTLTDFFEAMGEVGVAATYMTTFYQRRPEFQPAATDVPPYVPPHLRDEYRRRLGNLRRDMQGMWGLMGRIITGG